LILQVQEIIIALPTSDKEILIL